MRLKNTTDVPTETLRAIIRAVRPKGLGIHDVRVSNTRGRGACGYAYTQGSGYHARACPFVVVRVATTDERARARLAAHAGYLSHSYGSRIEALLFVLAHELRHLWQAKHPRGRRVWGSRGVLSERDADAYALHKLRQYRRGELVL